MGVIEAGENLLEIGSSFIVGNLIRKGPKHEQAQRQNLNNVALPQNNDRRYHLHVIQEERRLRRELTTEERLGIADDMGGVTHVYFDDNSALPDRPWEDTRDYLDQTVAHEPIRMAENHAARYNPGIRATESHLVYEYNQPLQ